MIFKKKFRTFFFEKKISTKKIFDRNFFDKQKRFSKNFQKSVFFRPKFFSIKKFSVKKKSTKNFRFQKFQFRNFKIEFLHEKIIFFGQVFFLLARCGCVLGENTDVADRLRRRWHWGSRQTSVLVWCVVLGGKFHRTVKLSST